jgi:hypothetical protein
MNVDRNEKIWALSNTGTKMHAFVQVWKDKDGNESANHLRALCRGTIARSADATFTSANYAIGVCPRCEKLAEAMWDRAEASMQPATEAQDLGYVAPAGKFTDTQRDSMQDAFDAAVAASQADAVIEGTPVIEDDHAEALEMDAAETPEPQRFHYRAVLATSGGTPLDGIEGYINAIDRDAAEDALKERYQTDLIHLTSLRINLA